MLEIGVHNCVELNRPAFTNVKIIFLDFDGVLHPKGAGGPKFTRLALFESLLREPAVVDVAIVISSTWRQAYSLQALRKFFAPDTAVRIVGCTPSLREYRTGCERGEEVEAWLSKHSASLWVALDDDADSFATKLHSRLVLCDGSVGLTEADVAKVRGMLT